jgi:hypothetical protein
MHHRALVALARAYTEFHKLESQQCAVSLGVLAQLFPRKFPKLAPLLGEVIDTHFVPVSLGHRLKPSASMVGAYFRVFCEVHHGSRTGSLDWVSFLASRLLPSDA